jgi:hypothetical protein
MTSVTGFGQHAPLGRGTHRQDAVPTRGRFGRSHGNPSRVSGIFANQFPGTNTYVANPPRSSSFYVAPSRNYSWVRGGGFGAILLTSLLVLGLLSVFSIFLI